MERGGRRWTRRDGSAGASPRCSPPPPPPGPTTRRTSARRTTAKALQAEGKYAAAGSYKKAVRLSEWLFGNDHENTAVLLNGLASAYVKMDRQAAEPLFLRALAIRDARLGKDHPQTAATALDPAILYAAGGEYAKAEPLCLRACAAFEAKLPKDHPDTAYTLINLAVLYADLSRFEAAEAFHLRPLAISSGTPSSTSSAAGTSCRTRAGGTGPRPLRS